MNSSNFGYKEREKPLVYTFLTTDLTDHGQLLDHPLVNDAMKKHVRHEWEDLAKAAEKGHKVVKLVLAADGGHSETVRLSLDRVPIFMRTVIHQCSGR